MLGRRGNYGGCFAAIGSLVPSLVDALLARGANPLLSGCFAAMVVWSSLADGLSPLLLDACLCFLGGYFATTAFSILQASISLMYHFCVGSVGRYRVVRVVALSFLFFLDLMFILSHSPLV